MHVGWVVEQDHKRQAFFCQLFPILEGDLPHERPTGQRQS
jgi:hypothetical protein